MCRVMGADSFMRYVNGKVGALPRPHAGGERREEHPT